MAQCRTKDQALKEKSIKIIQTKAEQENDLKTKQSFSDLQNNIKHLPYM